MIFHRKLIDELDFEKYRGKLWGHFGGLINYLSNSKLDLLYLHNDYLRPMIDSKTTWGHDCFNVMCHNWVDVVLNVKNFNEESKKNLILKSKNLTINSFATLRSKGLVDIHSAKLYKKDIEYFVGNKYLLILILSIVPVQLMNILRLLYVKVSKR